MNADVIRLTRRDDLLNFEVSCPLDSTGEHDTRMQSAIPGLLRYFDVDSQRKMRKSIRQKKRTALKHLDPNTDAEARHNFHEFVPAAALNSTGFKFEYEPKLNGKTPDWVDFDENILLECYTLETGGINATSRMQQNIRDKCSKYQSISANHQLGIMIAVYLGWDACWSFEECREEVSTFQAVFSDYDELVAIIFFQTSNVSVGLDMQQYAFFAMAIESRLEPYKNWECETMLIGGNGE